jgi:hypothetical protein
MRIPAAAAIIAGILCLSIRADVTVSTSTAVEVTKKCADVTKTTMDGSWIRAEPKLTGSLANLGLTGVIHLRFQYDVAVKDTAKKISRSDISAQMRQAYFKLPVSIMSIIAGRWYEVYSPGNNYFGRYLYGVSKDKAGTFTGNGSMNTNYSVLDGLKLGLNIKPIQCDAQLALLPQDAAFEDDYLLVMFGGSPVEGLKFNVAGNFEVHTPASKDPVNRFVVNAGYTLFKKCALGVFGEMAIVNFTNASDNMWFMAGVTTKAGPVLDRVQLELEIKNHRLNATADNNLAWMLLLQKKVLGLALDLNIGADPTVLGSKKITDVGAIFRATASF